MSGVKKQSFLRGTAILVAANFLVKIIGAVFKIPLAHILEEEGMALFSSAYNFYAILFVIATAGLPVAVSKMVSESVAKQSEGEARRIFYAALSLLTVIGLLGAFVLFFCAGLLAKSVGSENSTLGIMCVAPAIFFISVLSAFRGYFQGRSNMTPTAVSEVAEAIGKLVIGLALASLLLPTGIINSASGAVLGVTGGALLGCLSMVMIYLIDKRKMQVIPLPSRAPIRPIREIIFSLLAIAIPITLGAAVSSLTNLIDLFTIRHRLAEIVVSPQMHSTLSGFYALTAEDAAIGMPLSEKAAEILYGAYSGYAVPMFNLPLTIITALSMCLVPAISGAFAVCDKKKVQHLTEVSIRITTMFALPCAAGLSLLAEPILAVVYDNARAQSTLGILGWAVLFVCLVSVTTAILQASGRVMLPVKHMAIGGIIKIITNFFLIPIDRINIGGAPISTILCYLAIAALNLASIAKIIRPSFSFADYVLKPILATFLMGFAAVFVYQMTASGLGAPSLSGFSGFLPQSAPITPLASGIQLKTAIALLAAISSGALVYFVVLLLTKTLKKEDISTITRRS